MSIEDRLDKLEKRLEWQRKLVDALEQFIDSNWDREAYKDIRKSLDRIQPELEERESLDSEKD